MGLLPVPDPAEMAEVLLADLIIPTPPGIRLDANGLVPNGGGGILVDAPDETRLDGGADARPVSGWLVGPGGGAIIPVGGGVEAADLAAGGPVELARGGGGVALGPAAAASSGLAFLLTHFFRSGS